MKPTSNHFKKGLSAPKSLGGDVVGLFKPFKPANGLIKGEVASA